MFFVGARFKKLRRTIRIIEAGLVAACSGCKEKPDKCQKCSVLGWDYDNKTYRVCPQTLLEDWQLEALNAYRHYKNGLFAMAGGVGEQPIKYLEAMNIIESEINEIENEKINASRS